MVFDNGSANSICQKVYGIKKPDFHDLNKILSAQLTSMLFPTTSLQGGSRTFKPLADTAENLFFDTQYKFASVKYVPQMPLSSKSFSVESWDALESRVVQMTMGGSIEAEINWRIKSHTRKMLLQNSWSSKITGECCDC